MVFSACDYQILQIGRVQTFGAAHLNKETMSLGLALEAGHWHSQALGRLTNGQKAPHPHITPTPPPT